MPKTSAPNSEKMLSHLKRVATFHDSLGYDFQAEELYSAIRNLEQSGLPAAGSDDADRLNETLLEIEEFLDEGGYRFLARELRELRNDDEVVSQ